VIAQVAPPATLQGLADLVGGDVFGDPEVLIERVAPFETAGKGEITFVTQKKYLADLDRTKASAVIVPERISVAECNQLIYSNPYLAFARVQQYFHGKAPAAIGIQQGATIDPTAQLGEDISIYPGCYVGPGCTVGSGTILYPNVVLYQGVSVGQDCLLHAGSMVREHCRLGNRVVLQPGAIIGSDGFGFAPDGGKYEKIPQSGTVDIEDDVEIGACSCIDRAALGVTHIRRGCKIDNLVQVAHNVEVGEDTVMAAQVGIAGSTIIGRHCTFGGQAAAAGHIKIGENVTVAGRGGIASSVAGNQVLSGLPAMPHREWLKASMAFPRLPDMRRELHQLKNLVHELEQRLKEK